MWRGAVDAGTAVGGERFSEDGVADPAEAGMPALKWEGEAASAIGAAAFPV